MYTIVIKCYSMEKRVTERDTKQRNPRHSWIKITRSLIKYQFHINALICIIHRIYFSFLCHLSFSSTGVYRLSTCYEIPLHTHIFTRGT